MKESIIFCFTGTGNSLKAANDIAKNIENCKVLPMKNGNISEGEYEYIGFVFPVYFAGVPKIVYEFLNTFNTENIKNAYIFTVATCGGFHGNSIAIVEKILNKNKLKLNYGKSILMTANNIAIYNITNNIEKKETRYELKIKDIIKDILLKKTIPIKKEGAIFKLWHERFIKKVNGKDKKFNVSEKCISCGVCKKVCPVKNIEIKNKRPEFQHHCEQCFSCMHFCPEKAINYANRTQNRKRYHNRSFSFRDIEKFNHL